MTRRTRRPSPLLKRLRSLNTSGLGIGEVPTDLPHGEETSNLAFCPLLVKYVGKGMCGNVDCGRCELPALEYEDIETRHLCTVCAKEAFVLPYYGDGECDWCGFESSILMLCQVEVPEE